MAVTRKYAQIRRDGNIVCLIGDESLNMPINSECVYTINIESHEQKDIVTEGMVYNPASNTFASIIPVYDKGYGRYGPYPTEEILATSAKKEGTDTIALELPASAETGTMVKFVTPCDCVGISKLKVEDTTYTFTDSAGNTVADISNGEGGVFETGAIVAAVLNKDTGTAYIQNPSKTINETSDNLKDAIQNTELSADKVTSGTLSSDRLPTVPIDKGGTGGTTAEKARENLSIKDHATADIVPIASGGTGADTAAGARNNLGLGNTDGALPIANGGTGADTVAGARNNLGLGNTSGALPVANGGTGATTGANARKNLGITYGTAAPSGTPATGAGAIYFKIVT